MAQSVAMERRGEFWALWITHFEMGAMSFSDDIAASELSGRARWQHSILGHKAEPVRRG